LYQDIDMLLAMEPSMLLPVAVIVAVVAGGGLIGAYRPADEHLVAA
jgi:hypothetical protein